VLAATVVFALVLSIILVIGLGFVLGALSMGRGSGIGIALALLAALVYLYSRVFGTGMLGGFLIMLIANVIGAVVSVGLGLWWGSLTSGARRRRGAPRRGCIQPAYPSRRSCSMSRASRSAGAPSHSSAALRTSKSFIPTAALRARDRITSTFGRR